MENFDEYNFFGYLSLQVRYVTSKEIYTSK